MVRGDISSRRCSHLTDGLNGTGQFLVSRLAAAELVIRVKTINFGVGLHRGIINLALKLFFNVALYTDFMKYLAFLLSTFTFVVDAYSQTSIQVKLYQNSDFFQATYSSYLSSSPRPLVVQHQHFNRVTVAVNLTRKNNWMHELELFIPDVSRPVADAQFPTAYTFQTYSENRTSRVSTYAFRYEMSKVFHSDKRFYYSLGLGVNPYYTKAEYEPVVDTYYYNNYEVYGAGLNVIPRVAFKITKKLRADLNVPFKLYDLKREKVYVANPSIAHRHQHSAETAHEFFEKTYTLRLGVAYLLK
jgi:hypothetical protein